jgi:hypothetical protein
VVGVNVSDISQSRGVNASSFLAHDVAFEYAQIPGSAINPELLDSIHSLVFGNTNPNVLSTEQSNYLERGMPAGTSAGLRSTPNLSSDYWQQFFGKLSGERGVDTVSSEFEGFGLDDDLLSLLV